MSEPVKLCQFRQAHICCLPEGHEGSHFPVDVSEQWMKMLSSIATRDRQIKYLRERIEKYEPLHVGDEVG